MEQYIIDCTPGQTNKAIELGAPIKQSYNRFDDEELSPIINKDGKWLYAIIPTAEQMRGWLMDKLKATTFANKHYSCGVKEGFGFLIIGAECVLERDASDNGKHLLKSDKEATLAAIDAALEYLSNK